MSRLLPHAGEILGLRHVLPLRVYYEDTDTAGIVYYANYLKYAERGRSDFLRLAKVDQQALKEEQGVVFAVRRAEVDYHLPARLDEALEVESRFLNLKGASLEALQTIRRGESLLAEVRVRVACLNLESGRAVRLPKEVQAQLQPFCDEEEDI